MKIKFAINCPDKHGVADKLKRNLIA